MIIVRSPMRISLGGGGTDLPSYYQEYGGQVMAAAIDKYVYITIHQRFLPRLLLKYSHLEEVECLDDIRHPLIREALRLVAPGITNLEITSTADIPAGTGLGSSGSFLTALLKGLHAFKKNLIHPRELAEQACHIELDVLREPIGKQDQYIAAFGGITAFQFLPNGQVEAGPLKLDNDTIYNLEDNLLLFFTGAVRSASAILRTQDARSRERDRNMIANLHFIKEIGQESRKALEAGNPVRFAALMNEHWEYKRKRDPKISNDAINQWYELARANGALGGKLIGAGGGGFLLFYAEDRIRLRRALREAGLQEVRFRFDFEGTKTLIQS
jgi:D-glycero-alpha-D-manno-heptose-7-phosphate kinase